MYRTGKSVNINKYSVALVLSSKMAASEEAVSVMSAESSLIEVISVCFYLSIMIKYTGNINNICRPKHTLPRSARPSETAGLGTARIRRLCVENSADGASVEGDV